MMTNRDLLSLILSLLLVVALSVSSRAQAVYGSVFGTVTDPKGARVVGAVVIVTDLTRNVTTTSKTNESGNYTVTRLIPGKYSVKVERQGSLKTDRADVATNLDQQQIESLPNFDRNFTKFVLLSPGTQQLFWQQDRKSVV